MVAKGFPELAALTIVGFAHGCALDFYGICSGAEIPKEKGP